MQSLSYYILDSKFVSGSSSNQLLFMWLQFEEGKKLPTTFAFALVEHRNVDEMGGSGQTTDFRCLVRLRLRMYLAGEVISMNTENIKSSTRLQNMRMLLSDVGKPLYILKVYSFRTTGLTCFKEQWVLCRFQYMMHFREFCSFYSCEIHWAYGKVVAKLKKRIFCYHIL